jgi:hypothetical protein
MCERRLSTPRAIVARYTLIKSATICQHFWREIDMAGGDAFCMNLLVLALLIETP